MPRNHNIFIISQLNIYQFTIQNTTTLITLINKNIPLEKESIPSCTQNQNQVVIGIWIGNAKCNCITSHQTCTATEIHILYNSTLFLTLATLIYPYSVHSSDSNIPIKSLPCASTVSTNQIRTIKRTYITNSIEPAPWFKRKSTPLRATSQQ